MRVGVMARRHIRALFAQFEQFEGRSNSSRYAGWSVQKTAERVGIFLSMVLYNIGMSCQMNIPTL